MLATIVGRTSNDELAADLNRYTNSQARLQRILSIVSSSISLFSGLLGLYMFLIIDWRKRVFRHQLIIFLIIYDFIKALFLLMYPARVIAHSSVYFDVPFCKVVGFFTAMSIEGSDIAIASFAIHAALLIYLPNNKIKRGTNYEGGLYRYRYFVYLISFLLPILLAGLALINNVGYAPLTNWCYLPSRPIWYRLALSWIPRYLLILFIFIIYGCIYHHVTKQYRDLEEIMVKQDGKVTEKKPFWKKLYELTGFIICNKIHISENYQDECGRNMGSTGDESLSEESQGNILEMELKNTSRIQSHFSKEAINGFKKRRIQAEKQMKAIFIYPVSYVILWLAPLIVHAMDLKLGLSQPPIIWLNAIAAFMQPFNCTVDTLVFMIREKPWKMTTINVDTCLTEEYSYPTWRHRISFLPLFALPAPLKERQSEQTRTGQQIDGYNPHDYSNLLSGSADLDFIKPEARNSDFAYDRNSNGYNTERAKKMSSSNSSSREDGILNFSQFLERGPSRTN